MIAMMSPEAAKLPDIPEWCVDAKVYMPAGPEPQRSAGLLRSVRNLLGTVRAARWEGDDMVDLLIAWHGVDGPVAQELVQAGYAELVLAVDVDAARIEVELVRKQPYAPGSVAAVEAGCTCPEVDNGRGSPMIGRLRGFTIAGDCPLHASA